MKYRASRNVKVGRGIAMLVLMAIMFGAGWVVREHSQRSWVGSERFTIITTRDNGVGIESFDPVTLEAIRVKLPEELEIETVGGRGRWKVAVLPQLAEKDGWKWVADSVADYLGISYTAVDREMNSWDKINWWRLGRKLTWKEIQLGETGMVSEAQAVDRVTVLGLAEGQWDNWARSRFESSALAAENISVKVINTTGTAGLASHAARVVESSGLKVSMIENGEISENRRCEVRGKKDVKNNLGVIFLSKQFECAWSADEDLNSTEVELVLGGDYRRWWLGE